MATPYRIQNITDASRRVSTEAVNRVNRYRTLTNPSTGPAFGDWGKRQSRERRAPRIWREGSAFRGPIRPFD